MLAVLAVMLLLAAVLAGAGADPGAAADRRGGDRWPTACPSALALANDKLVPWLREHFGITLRLRSGRAARSWRREHGQPAEPSPSKLFQSLKIGGIALFGLLVNLLLTPVVMFYLLLDWHRAAGAPGQRHPARLACQGGRPWRATSTPCCRSSCAASCWSC